jgi:molybdate transport system permease protein
LPDDPSRTYHRRVPRRRSHLQERTGVPIVEVAAAAVLCVLLVLPTFTLLARAASPQFLASLLKPAAIEALRLSLLSTAVSVAITVVVGTPVAYLLARYRFPGRRLFDTLVGLPIVLPPVVAGLSLLLVFGRRGLLGAPLAAAGIHIPFTTAAVVMAQLFVAAPYFVRAAKSGFEAVPERLEAVSWTLGKSRRETFWRVTVPLTFPFLVEGAALAWARALGEFGATIVFAGSLAGRTRTMPLTIYAALESDLGDALALSAVLAVVAFALLFAFRFVLRLREVEP